MNAKRMMILLFPAVALLMQSAAQAAEPYPTRPIRFVVGFLPGGPSDTIARVVSAKLGEILGKPVVIDNRAGAGGNLSADIVAHAQPDGYTMLLGTGGPLVIAPIIGQKIGFNADRDFAPVTKLGNSMSIVAAHPSLPASNVRELIALAKAKPGELTYASSGVGSPEHFAGEMFKMMTGTDILMVPYKGGGPIAIDLVAGHVMTSFSTMPPIIPFVRSGRVRAVAVTKPRRAAVLPDVPTIAESGVPGGSGGPLERSHVAHQIGIGDRDVVQHGHQRRVAVRGQARRGHRGDVVETGEALPHLLQDGRRQGVTLRLVHEHLRGRAGHGREVLAEHLDAGLGPRVLDVVVVLGGAPERGRDGDDRRGDDDPGEDRSPGMGGGGAAEPVQQAGHGVHLRVVVDWTTPRLRGSPGGALGVDWRSTGGAPQSAADEGEAHLTVRVVDVQVDQADALPGAECEPTAEHRNGGVRRDQRRHHVRPAVTAAAVPVPPAVVRRQQVRESGEQVVVAARPGLEDGDPRRRVRHVEMQQTVALVGDERLAVAGEVKHGVAGSGAVAPGLAAHGHQRPRVPGSRAPRVRITCS